MKRLIGIISLCTLFAAGCSTTNSVDLSEYTKLVEEKEALKIRLEDSISKEEYDKVVEENESLQAELENRVPKEEYEKLMVEHENALALLQEYQEKATAPSVEEDVATDAEEGGWSEEEYVIATDVANVRYAENNDRIYAQLSKGTPIGRIRKLKGSDYVEFVLDGVPVVIRSEHIKPAN